MSILMVAFPLVRKPRESAIGLLIIVVTGVPYYILVAKGLAPLNFMRELTRKFPDSKVHGANMGPIWGRQDPGGPHVGAMNFVIWVVAL